MTGWVLAVALAAALALLLVVTLSLGRQVRELRGEVAALARHRQPAQRNRPTPLSAEPMPTDSTHDAVVIHPTPIGPAEVEPDLSVSRVASVTLAGPLIKVAAFSHGVRRALDEESRMRVAYAFRKELRRQRRVRRKRAAARAAGPPRDGGWRA